ncbi:MAG: hypothetical protein MK110_12140 [Fuerstiella sp.]|nr:hypothetical protein [Fuerstiella sp.]
MLRTDFKEGRHTGVQHTSADHRGNAVGICRDLGANEYDRMQRLATVIEALYARSECAAVV